jgi:SLT domain-containing protein
VASGGNGLPKVSVGPAMPYLSEPYGRPAAVSGVANRRAGGLRPSSTPFDTQRRALLRGKKIRRKRIGTRHNRLHSDD